MKARTNIIVAIFLVACLALTGCVGTQVSEADSEMNSDTDSEMPKTCADFSGYGVSIQYPEGWNLYSVEQHDCYTEKGVLMVNESEDIYISCFVSTKTNAIVVKLYPSENPLAEAIQEKVEETATLADDFPEIPEDRLNSDQMTSFLLTMSGYLDNMEDPLPAFTGTLPEKESAALETAELSDDGSLACAKDETELWGYVNRNGDWVIPPTFGRTSDFSEGLAFVKLPDSEDGFFIDWTGEVVIDDVSYNGESYAMLSAEQFHDGLCLVKLDNGTTGNVYVYIDKTGTVVIDAEGFPMQAHESYLNDCFEYATSFNGGYAVVQRSVIRESGRTFGLIEDAYIIDTNGDIVATIPGDKYVVSSEWQQFGVNVNGCDENGLIQVADVSTGLLGFMNTSAELAVPCEYNGIDCAGENIYLAYKNDDKYGYVDGTGNVLIDFKFASANEFIGGLALVSDDFVKYGFIDRSGSYVIPAVYDEAADLNKGLEASDFTDCRAIAVMQGDYWGVIDADGNVLIDFTYNTANCPFNKASHGTISFCSLDSEGYTDQYGILTTGGKLVKEPCFQSLSGFHDAGVMS